MICTISPAQRHAVESLNSLSFARSCSRVTNTTRANLITGLRSRNRPWADATKEVKLSAPEPMTLPWKGLQRGDDACSGGRLQLKTRFGLMSALAYGPTVGKGLALCIHGHPSNAEEAFGSWLLPALVYAGYYAVALDMPGRGSSGGVQLKTRSEFNLETNGACDVVQAVIEALGFRTAVLVGYDWGGGIALSMARSKAHKKMVEKLVAFHPSYNETRPGELEEISCPTQVIWCKQDQLHSWNKWSKLAAVIQKTLGASRYSQYLFSCDVGEEGWGKHSPAIEQKLVHFLTGTDYGADPKSVSVRPTRIAQTTEGETVTQIHNVVVLGRGLGAFDAASECFADRNVVLEAVTEFTSLYNSGKLIGMYKALIFGGPKKQAATRLFSMLPVLCPESIAAPSALVDLGVWPQGCLAGWLSMTRRPRYVPGRRVLVALPGNLLELRPAEPGFMCLTAEAAFQGRDALAAAAMTVAPEDSAVEGFVTWRAIIAAGDHSGCKIDVEIEVVGGGTAVVPVSRETIIRLNNPHSLPTTPASGVPGYEVRLEDGLRCNYGALLCRAKMLEAALAVAQTVASIDFNSQDQEAVEVSQLEAVRQIRHSINMVTFQRNEMGELTEKHTRDRRRYCGDSVPRLATFGQGHCHTVSSTMYSVLHPFCSALGIDLKYRGGYTFDRFDKSEQVRNSPERHQWLEFTSRLSGNSFTCDLYRQDGVESVRDCADNTEGVRDFLTAPMPHTYTKWMYPHGIVKKFCGFPSSVSSSGSDFNS